MRKPSRGAALSILALALVALPVVAQRYGETTSTVVVEVPVQVLRDGQPVRGLTKDDFMVYDGRKQQQITGFEVIDLQSAPTTPTAAPTSTARRHFLLLFDLAYSNLKAVVKAREAALDMVQQLHPTDLVAVASYTSLGGPQLVLGFTPDRAQIDAALKSLGNPELLNHNRDPLRLAIRDAMMTGTSVISGGSEARGNAKAEAADFLKSLADQSARAERHADQQQIINLSHSMADLAKLMGTIQGRKYVVYLSEGFDSSLVSGSTSLARQNEMNTSVSHGEIWNVDSEERYGDTKSLNELEKMLEELRRADCVVEAVDIAGLRPASDDLDTPGSPGQSPTNHNYQDTLLNFAKSTGGELFENMNDLSGAMGEMLERTSVTYVLAFQPDKLTEDGSYHRLRVELKNGKGLKVMARPGYYAPRPFAERSASEKMLEAQTQVVSGEETGALDLAVLAAPFAMPGNENAYVPVVIEVDGKTLLAGKQPATLPAELYAYAFDSKGVLQDYLTQSVGLDLGVVRPALEASGFKFFGHLELPPGDYTLRVLVRNASTGGSGVRMVPLHVPAYAQSESALLPAFVPEPQGRWLMQREQPRGKYQKAPYPFMMAGTPFIPASRPVLQPGQEAQVALVGYSLPDGQLEAHARVLSVDGREMGPAAIQVLKRETGSKPARLVANVTPPQLAPGEYRLEVKLAGAGTAQTSTTSFVVR